MDVRERERESQIYTPGNVLTTPTSLHGLMLNSLKINTCTTKKKKKKADKAKTLVVARHFTN